MTLAVGAAWAAASASGSPATGLKDGSTVTISGTGFGSNTSLFIVQCSGLTGDTACDIPHFSTTKSDASGVISATFTVHTGAIGNGTCVAGSTSCIIAIADQAKTYPAFFALTFAAAPVAVTPTKAPTKATTPAVTTPATSTTGSKATAGSGQAVTSPVTVAAGSGGQADRHGHSPALALAIGLGGTALVGGTARQRRRRQTTSE